MSKRQDVDIIIWQLVVDKIFEELMVISLGDDASTVQRERSLTDVEKNAIYYAGGFVAKKLLKKYASKPDFKECLAELVAEKDEALSLDCATWLEHTDRGGLCKLSKLGFRFFSAIEVKTYGILDGKFKNKDSSTTDDICRLVADDDEVQDLWSVIAFDITIASNSTSSSTAASALLRDVICEWIVMRGHSLRGKYMDDFKKKKKEKDKAKALRKTLKRKSS